jgi:hypothetical protein
MNTGLNGNSSYLRDVMGLAGAMHPLIAGAQKKLEQANRRSFDNPSIANARWAGGGGSSPAGAGPPPAQPSGPSWAP